MAAGDEGDLKRDPNILPNINPATTIQEGSTTYYRALSDFEVSDISIEDAFLQDYAGAAGGAEELRDRRSQISIDYPEVRQNVYTKVAKQSG